MRLQVRGTAQTDDPEIEASAGRAGFECIDLQDETIQMIIFSRAMAMA
jgi:hypothetical protein